jgi:hypothetical protein
VIIGNITVTGLRLPIVLDWQCDSMGYRFADHGKYGVWMVRKGGRLIRTHPLERNDMLFRLFCNVKTADQALNFVKEYGFLNDPDPSPTVRGYVDENFDLNLIPSAPEIAGEKVDNHIGTAALFRDILDQAKRGFRRVPPQLNEALAEELSERSLGDIQLIGDRRVGFRSVLRARSLMDAMWFQLATNISESTDFHPCGLCGELFPRGRGTGRRADAIFCNNAHKIEFHSRNRSKRD